MKGKNSSLETLLFKLGFSSSTSKLYLYILKRGELTTSELPTKFSSFNVENNLRWLEENRLILRRIDPEQKEYVRPINPQVVSRSLYSKFLWRYIPAEEWLLKLSKNKLKDVAEYYKVCSAFSQKFTPIYEKSVKTEESILGLEMVPKERLPNVLSSILSTASEEILGITIFPWTPSIELIWETLKERIGAGVKYRRIADEITLVAFGHLINHRDIFEIGVNLGVLNRNEILEKFFLVDSQRAFIFFPGSPPQNFKLEGMEIVENSLVKMYKETFECLWNKAILGSEVIKYMESLKKDFLNNVAKYLTKEEKNFIEGLVDYGKFYRLEYSSLPLQRITSLLSFLSQKNYVIPFPDSEIRFIPNLIDPLRKLIETRRNER